MYKAVTSWESNEVARDKSQTACIKKARLYVENNPGTRVNIIIVKELAGNSQCATVTYKKSTTEKLGLYKFIGLAAD